MPKYSYVAMDPHGKETKGTLEVASQNEAIGRVKEMGLFPTKIVEVDKAKEKAGQEGRRRRPKPAAKKKGKGLNVNLNIKIPGLGGRVKSKVLTTFTRQLATLVDAGLPLLRGLRVLEKQERNPTLKSIIGELALSIEGGSTFSEGLAQHPKVFNRLFVNMVKAGELGGVLEVVLNRLSEFMEKAQKIKGKVIAAMFYPIAVLVVAMAILTILMVYVIPKFKEVFAGMLEGAQLPAFTRFVLGISDTVKDHFIVTVGRRGRLRRRLHALHPHQIRAACLRQVQAQDAGHRPGRQQGRHLPLHPHPRHPGQQRRAHPAGPDHRQGDRRQRHHRQRRQLPSTKASRKAKPSPRPLEASGVFPPMVISMVDVGEQTGALPEMLLKIADNYDDEVDNAVAAMTSLLEPIMIVFLAVIVGSIVIAMFLPLIELMNSVGSESGKEDKE